MRRVRRGVAYWGVPVDGERQAAVSRVRRPGPTASDRVGRTAAGRALDTSAVDLAVTAHIRHAHTNYDELLMRGTERLAARTLVREKITDVLAKWSRARTSDD